MLFSYCLIPSGWNNAEIAAIAGWNYAELFVYLLYVFLYIDWLIMFAFDFGLGFLVWGVFHVSSIMAEQAAVIAVAVVNWGVSATFEDTPLRGRWCTCPRSQSGGIWIHCISCFCLFWKLVLGSNGLFNLRWCNRFATTCCARGLTVDVYSTESRLCRQCLKTW